MLIWAAVLACAVAWGLPLFTHSTPLPPGTSLAAPLPPVGAGLSRLLGQPAAQPVAQTQVVVADSRFRLVGVVAPRQGSGSANGLALIEVDGKPARAWRVGRELEPGMRLLSVGHRQAQLGAGAGSPSLTLQLPALAEAQRGRPGDPAAAMAQPGLPGLPPGLQPGMQPSMRPGMNQGMVVGQPFFGGAAQRQPGMQQPPMALPPVPVPQGVPEPNQNSLPYQPDGNGNPLPTEPSPPPATAPRFQ